jgi:hypothetical protein
MLRGVSDRIARYAGSDAELCDAERDLERYVYHAAKRKEECYGSQTRSRGQRDLRPCDR